MALLAATPRRHGVPVAFLAEAQHLVLIDLAERGRVVELGDVDILRPRASNFP